MRASAAWALGSIGTADALAALVRHRWRPKVSCGIPSAARLSTCRRIKRKGESRGGERCFRRPALEPPARPIWVPLPVFQRLTEVGAVDAVGEYTTGVIAPEID